LLNEANKIRPRPPDELLKELIDIHGLSNELAKQLIRSPALATYLDLVNEIGKIVSPQTIATTLLIHIKTIKSEGYNTEKIEFHHLIELLKNVGEGKVAKEAIPEILKEVCLRPEAKIDEILSKFTGLTVQDLNRIVDGIINEYKDIINERGEKSFGLIMGRVMAKVRGRIDGKIVAEVVRSRLRTFLHKK
jgi:glutamyl-tRNA(Gln) amidotransferase subunit E